MVSPSKKKRPEKRARETIGSEQLSSRNQLGTRKANKSVKPLSDKKFYLDIKNHASLKKLEDKLKSLGASLELFLVKDVDYVVTDRTDYPGLKGGHQEQHHYQSPPTSRGAPNTPHHLHLNHQFNPSPFCSVSPATTDSPTDGVTYKRTRSRAEAMLECLKQQPSRAQTTCGDVLDNAASWRIPIYPLSRFIEWLEKVARRAEKSGGAVSCGVKELRGSYLKIEAAGARPEFRLFDSWPRLNLDNEDGSGGFTPHRTTRSHARANNLHRMTRKVGRGTKDVTTGGGAGYCEVCRLQYGQLEEHINSATHLKLVSDPTQYSQLDSIITQHSLGPGSRKSLRIAKSPPPNFCEMGGKQSSSSAGGGGDVAVPATPSLLNGHHINTRSSKQTPLPLQQCQVHCNGVGSQRILTRSKGSSEQQQQATSVIEETSNNNRIPCSPARRDSTSHNLRSRRSTPAKRSRVSRKRLSAEEKLIEDNKAYYRVEVLNSKLRSTGYMISSQRQQENRAISNNQVNGADKVTDTKVEEKEPVVVRFKKVRKTQLALLSDEAESFMFGEPTRREESSPEEESEGEEDKESVTSEDSGKRKRRRTHAEAFIHDNMDYYKFQTPGSRLRYQSPQLILDKLPLISLSLPATPHPPPLREIDLEKLKADTLKFSFESDLSREPWWNTYRRQDAGDELFVRRHYTYPTVVLPYEMPPERGGRTGGGGRRRGFSERLTARLAVDDRPRKSPRCHASTLAIMSSLMRRGRPRNDSRSEPQPPPPVMSFGEEDTRSSLPDTFESSSNSELKLVCESDAKILEGRVNDMLTASCLSGSDRLGDAILKAVGHGKPTRQVELELDDWPCLDVDPRIFDEPLPASPLEPPGLTMNISSLLATFHQCPAMDISEFIVSDYLHYRPFDAFRSGNFDSCNSSDCSDLFGFAEDGRVVSGRRKKRKKRNMTGWPLGKPKKKLIVKSEPPPMNDDASQSGGWFNTSCVKQEVLTDDYSSQQPPPPVVVKRKVGRPPKNKPPVLQPVTQQPPPLFMPTLPPAISESPLSSPPPKKRRVIGFQARYRY